MSNGNGSGRCCRPPPPRRRGRHYTTDHRTTLEGILWIARTGAPWRDLPAVYGKWSTVYRRFNRWAKKGIFEQALASLDGEPDLATLMVDGTFVKAHQHGCGSQDRRPSADRQ